MSIKTIELTFKAIDSSYKKIRLRIKLRGNIRLKSGIIL